VEQQFMPDPSPLLAQKAHKGGGGRRGRSSGTPMANDYIPRGDARKVFLSALDHAIVAYRYFADSIPASALLIRAQYS
jgi:hypothetical protein